MNLKIYCPEGHELDLEAIKFTEDPVRDVIVFDLSQRDVSGFCKQCNKPFYFNAKP